MWIKTHISKVIVKLNKLHLQKWIKKKKPHKKMMVKKNPIEIQIDWSGNVNKFIILWINWPHNLLEMMLWCY